MWTFLHSFGCRGAILPVPRLISVRVSLYGVVVLMCLQREVSPAYSYLAILISSCVVCVLIAPLTGYFSIFLLGPPDSLRQNNIELRPINNPTLAHKCSSERKC